MQDKNQQNKLDLSEVNLKGRFDFARVLIRNRSKISNALNIFFKGVKSEASDTKETSRIIVKYVGNQKIAKEEEQHLKKQVYDMFKILGIGIPFVLIPGAAILIPLLLKAAEKRGIDLLPSNFKASEQSPLDKNNTPL